MYTHTHTHMQTLPPPTTTPYVQYEHAECTHCVFSLPPLCRHGYLWYKRDSHILKPIYTHARTHTHSHRPILLTSQVAPAAAAGRKKWKKSVWKLGTPVNGVAKVRCVARRHDYSGWQGRGRAAMAFYIRPDPIVIPTKVVCAGFGFGFERALAVQQPYEGWRSRKRVCAAEAAIAGWHECFKLIDAQFHRGSSFGGDKQISLALKS